MKPPRKCWTECTCSRPCPVACGATFFTCRTGNRRALWLCNKDIARREARQREGDRRCSWWDHSGGWRERRPSRQNHRRILPFPAGKLRLAFPASPADKMPVPRANSGTLARQTLPAVLVAIVPEPPGHSGCNQPPPATAHRPQRPKSQDFAWMFPPQKADRAWFGPQCDVDTLSIGDSIGRIRKNHTNHATRIPGFFGRACTIVIIAIN